MTWLLEIIKLLMLIALIGPSVFCAIFAFIGKFEDKKERKMWLLASVYGGISSALLFLFIGP